MREINLITPNLGCVDNSLTRQEYNVYKVNITQIVVTGQNVHTTRI